MKYRIADMDCHDVSTRQTHGERHVADIVDHTSEARIGDEIHRRPGRTNRNAVRIDLRLEQDRFNNVHPPACLIVSCRPVAVVEMVRQHSQPPTLFDRDKPVARPAESQRGNGVPQDF